MIISFDLLSLKSKNLTPGEYCILKCLNSLEYDILQECFGPDKPIISLEEFESLQLKGFIKIASDTMDFTKIHFRQAARDLFDLSGVDKKFHLLFSMYPAKVPDGRGSYRILRAKSLDSSEAKNCKEKFNRLVKKDPIVADQMIKGLEKQLETTRGSLQYMQQFSVWMNQRTWEKYYDLEDEPTEDSHREKL